MNKNVTIGQQARGMFKVQRVDAKTGQVIEDRPWRKNLILNSGLNMIHTRYWADAWRYASAGSGSDANYEDSGVGTAASDAAGNVTFTGYSLAASREGSIILWDTGEKGRVFAGSGGACIIKPAPGGGGIADGEFTLFRAERTTLVTPRVGFTYGFTGVCLASYPHTFTSVTTNTVLSRRTWDFPVEGSTVTYNEVGTHPVNANGTTCFSRMTIPGGITLDAGEQLRLVYQVTVTMNPVNAVQTGTMDIFGWPVAPALTTDVTWAIWELGLTGVDSSGNTNSATGVNWGVCNEPAALGAPGIDGGYSMWVTNQRQGFGTWSWPSTAPAHTGVLNSSYAGWPKTDNYVSDELVYSHDKQLKINATNGNYDTYGYITGFGQGFGMSTYPFYQAGQTMVGWYCEFDEDQKKTNIQNLLLGMKWSWSRELDID